MKLIVAFAVILLVSSITIGAYSHQTAKSQLEEELTENANRNADLLNAELDRILDARFHE